ncbi:MAG: metallophosphoesterase [Clostridia bacterium]|nr:metallophosphoesterase [Clostridia bacterium]
MSQAVAVKKKKKRSAGKKALIAIITIVLILAIIAGVFVLIGYIGNKANTEHARSLLTVTQEDPLAAPVLDEETGYYTFTCDRTFKVLQLTDVHIGGGPLSIRKDGLAIDAVYKMVQMTRPDLIIITGDMAYPVPYASGSFNNLNPAKIFVEMMESIGVYWTIAYGNHDTEAYAFYTREQISEYYSSISYNKNEKSHCLFYEIPEDEKVDGCGNYFINVKNSAGIITQSFIVFDSHSYKTGFLRDYDNIHPNQIEWYKSEIARLDAINRSHGATKLFKSMAFFHIPLTEMQDAFDELTDSGANKAANGNYIFSDSANTKYLYGNIAEKPDSSGAVVYSGTGDDDVYETMQEIGSTQAVFFGHDHINNFAVLYKGNVEEEDSEYNGDVYDDYIQLTYGMSIDYLAYFGIAKKTAQRGGTVIEVAPDGSFVSYAKRLIDGKEYRTPEDWNEINK